MLGRAEHASSQIGGRVPHKMSGGSCIGVLQKEEKAVQEKTASTTDSIVTHMPVKKSIFCKCSILFSFEFV